MLDNCSTRSFINRKTFEALDLPINNHITEERYTLGRREITTNPETTVELEGNIEVPVVVLPQIIPSQPTQDYRVAQNQAKKAFPSINFRELRGNTITIDILLGLDVLDKFNEKKILRTKGLELRKTKSGYAIQGLLSRNNGNTTKNELQNGIVMVTTNSKIDSLSLLEDDKLDSAINEAFNHCEFTELQDRTPEDEEQLKKFYKGIKKVKDGDGEGTIYEVPMMWKAEDSREKVPVNKKQSLGFCSSNAEKLAKMGKAEQWDKLITKYEGEGYMREFDPQDPAEQGKRHTYVPAFAVLNPKSTTTPMRVVLSANLPKGNSVNMQLAKGLNLLQPLDKILRNFRVHQTGVSADISAAYYQLKMKEEDSRSFCFFVFRNTKEQKNLIHMYLTRVPMGSTSALTQLLGTITFHLDHHQDSEATKILRENYSDNVIFSLPDENPQDLILRAVQVMQDGSFQLCKFSTNSVPLAKALTEKGLYNEKEPDKISVLGMVWLLKTDQLMLNPLPPFGEQRITKRLALSQLQSCFDPLGLSAGVSIRGIAFFSTICSEYGWDEPLKEDDTTKWRTIYEEMRLATSIKIPRCYDIDPGQRVRLHTFTDASNLAGAAISMLEQKGKSIFVGAKTKIPAKRLRESGITTPRRELEALVLGGRLIDRLKKTFEGKYPTIEFHLYSDSEICLHWATGQKSGEVFVNNRTKLLHEILPPNTALHYIGTHENPADPLSRGMEAKDFLDPQNIIWTGPPIIHEETIPVFETNQSDNPTGQIVLNTVTEEVSTPAPPSVLQLIDDACGRSMEKVRRRIAAVIRCFRKWRKLEPLDARALAKLVALKLIKAEQEICLKNELSYLRGQKIPRPDKVHPLGLFLDQEGVVRVKGRLGNANIGWARRHPVYYPARAPLYTIRVMEQHRLAKHAGPAITKYRLQHQFWIPKAGQSIRKTIKKCFDCRRATGPAFKGPASPPLPADRVVIRPYSTIGVDFTGHYFVRTGKGTTTKVYICLISCASTRHFMGYLLPGMTVEGFLHCLRQHSATYGGPLRVISDRASYFVKTAEVLGERLGEEFCSEVGEKLGKKGVVWSLNAAAAPHTGGLFERLIGTMKSLMRRCIGRRLLDHEELSTLVKECCCVANDRPLSIANPSDIRDRLPITPNHLVLGRALSPLPYGEDHLEDLNDPSYLPDDTAIDKTWKKLSAKLATFRSQFAEEYLEYLRVRHSYDHHHDPVEPAEINVGDLVLIKKDNLKRSLWELGTVSSIFPSSDGKKRAAYIHTNNGTISRPITKLVSMVQARDLYPDGQPPQDLGQPEQQEEPVAAPVPSATSTRPQRAAKTAGRERVQRWITEMKDEDED